ncbi:MAG: dockerin type I repeat-containing protein [Oscillospiraceae bacterium]|nr:dockerin type I repeat-containing protein [Oscillospiraceae bacterium]
MKIKKLVSCFMAVIITSGILLSYINIDAYVLNEAANKTNVRKADINFQKSVVLPPVPITTTAVTTSVQITTTVSNTEPSTETTVPSYTGGMNLVKYGDVNTDGFVNSADVVVLNKYLINKEKYPLTSDIAYENADCVYDSSINSKDSMAIINVVLNIVTDDKIGKI